MADRLGFVVIGNAPYHCVIKTSKQMVTEQIARRYPTLYVEPPPLTLDPIVKPDQTGRYLDYRKGIVHDGPDRPMVLCPPPFRQAMDTRWRPVDTVNQALLGRYIKKRLRELPFDRFVLISFVYNAAGIARILNPDLFVFYCIDLFSDLPIPYANPNTVRQIEARTVLHADLVFAISQKLQKRLVSINDNVVYAPHGVQYDLFSQADSPGALPDDLQSIPSPRIGFVGSLASWLDYELMLNLARSRRDWNLCLVGPVEHDVDLSALAAEPNVHLLGQRTRQQVVDYLRGFDVGLVPFLVNDLTVHSNPLKALEYMAAGLPVVSTPLPEMERLCPPVHIAQPGAEFLEAVEQALSSFTDEEKSASKQIARNHAWEARVDRVIETILENLPQP